jgi:hypothetical protein
MIGPGDARKARDGIAEIIASADRGEVEVTDTERTFLSGSVAALDHVVGDAEQRGLGGSEASQGH